MIGPPPIPKNEDKTPKNKPTIKENIGFLKFFVFIFAFFSVYTKTAPVRITIIIFCTSPTNASFPAAFLTISKTCFPAIPPTAPPIASISVLKSSFKSFLLLRRETIVIVRTVVPLKKLIWEVVRGKEASITGLIRTPPPIPLIDPTIVATNTTIEKTNINMTAPYIYL